MEELKARQSVVKAGLELVESGLIARTWGNVSCRVDQSTFVITPSGKPYETLQTEEIVLCKIEDCSYEGDSKPSSEKRLHALIYQTYPDMNFVIHTHQKLASVISATNIGRMPVEGIPLLGAGVLIAGYGLPGTKKLKKGVETAITGNQGHAVIMAHHGALCYGKDYDEAFLTANQLEKACLSFLMKTYLKISKEAVFEQQNLYRYYVSTVLGKRSELPSQPVQLYSSRRTSNGFVFEAESEKEYQFTEDMPAQAYIHSLIYQKREDINFISQDKDMGLVAVSCTGSSLKPLLDDFAQIVGMNARCTKSIRPEEVVKALEGRLGAFVPEAGALCIAATKSDLQAVQMVMEKNVTTQIWTQLFGGGRALSRFDCWLMHLVYQKSYAKRAKE